MTFYRSKANLRVLSCQWPVPGNDSPAAGLVRDHLRFDASPSLARLTRSTSFTSLANDQDSAAFLPVREQHLFRKGVSCTMVILSLMRYLWWRIHQCDMAFKQQPSSKGIQVLSVIVLVFFFFFFSCLLIWESLQYWNASIVQTHIFCLFIIVYAIYSTILGFIFVD